MSKRLINNDIMDMATRIIYEFDEEKQTSLGLGVSSDYGGGQIVDLVLAAFHLGHKAGRKSEEAYLRKGIQQAAVEILGGDHE